MTDDGRTLQRPAPFAPGARPFAAAHSGTCQACGGPFVAGDTIVQTTGGWGHPDCPAQLIADARFAARDTAATALKALNIAREAFDDAGHSVSIPGQSEAGEFYVEVDGVNIAVKIESI